MGCICTVARLRWVVVELKMIGFSSVNHKWAARQLKSGVLKLKRDGLSSTMMCHRALIVAQ